jgi:hypothetical protein
MDFNLAEGALDGSSILPLCTTCIAEEEEKQAAAAPANSREAPIQESHQFKRAIHSGEPFDHQK